MTKPNPELLKRAMREDAEQKNQMMEWLRDSGMAKAGVVTAAIAAVLGIGGMAKSVAENESKKQPMENFSERPIQDYDSHNTDGGKILLKPESREVGETQEMRDHQLAEDILNGKMALGEAGTDKVNYGKLGHGAPQLTQEDWNQMYEAYSKVGQGISQEEIDQLGRDLAKRAGLSEKQMEQLQEAVKRQVENTQRVKGVQKAVRSGKTISWEQAVAQTGYQR
ncbi:MAG: hypothetical protein IJ770_01935 [Alphaproteobacteria bacterium]|nr:hypothetical protein [Alphaproteobacteria bacterium]